MTQFFLKTLTVTSSFFLYNNKISTIARIKKNKHKRNLYVCLVCALIICKFIKKKELLNKTKNEIKRR